MRKTKLDNTGKLTGEGFDALPPAEKDRIYQEFDRLTPEQIEREFRPMSAGERSRHMPSASTGGASQRKHVKTISVSIEKDLLKQADTYAKQHGLKRGQLIAWGLRRAIRGNARDNAA